MKAIYLACCFTLVPPFVWAVEPLELARGVMPQHPQQPQLAIDAKGNIHVVFGLGGQLRYYRSTNAGKSYVGSPEFPSVHGMALGMRRGPRIVATETTVCISAIGSVDANGKKGNLLAVRSTDDGATWVGPVRVNDTDQSAREGLHAMAAGPQGDMCCVWLDLRNDQTEVMASTSLDGGTTWSKNSLVYKSPDGSVCECCHPSVAFNRQGHIVIMWRNSLDGNRDMHFVASSDGGKTFSKATKLGEGSWSLDACPMDGGSLAIAPSGKVASVWRRDSDIYLSLHDGTKERPLGSGEQPWIAATEAGQYVVWSKKRGEAAYLLTPGNVSPIEIGVHASYPVIAVGPPGQGQVVAAWETSEGKNFSIQCQVVSEPIRRKH
jgi:hypothetical protein